MRQSLPTIPQLCKYHSHCLIPSAHVCSTSIDIQTTVTDTVILYTRLTSTTTATVTTATLIPKNKRQLVPTERAVLRRATAADEVEAIAGLILAGASISNPIDPSLIAPIASACSCLDLGPEYTITTTFTDVPLVRLHTHVSTVYKYSHLIEHGRNSLDHHDRNCKQHFHSSD
jgi:hypothetical protein